ncbi:MAG: hypothetical protein ACYSWU_05180 [Planctomycetota bacterium]|jgi:hypothetical protein
MTNALQDMDRLELLTAFALLGLLTHQGSPATHGHTIEHLASEAAGIARAVVSELERDADGT